MTGRGGGGSERHTVYAEMLGWSAALPISAMWRHIHTHMGEMSGTSPHVGTDGHHHSPPIGPHLARLMTWLHEEGERHRKLFFKKFSSDVEVHKILTESL